MIRLTMLLTLLVSACASTEVLVEYGRTTPSEVSEQLDGRLFHFATSIGANGAKREIYQALRTYYIFENGVLVDVVEVRPGRSVIID